MHLYLEGEKHEKNHSKDFQNESSHQQTDLLSHNRELHEYSTSPKR